MTILKFYLYLGKYKIISKGEGKGVFTKGSSVKCGEEAIHDIFATCNDCLALSIPYDHHIGSLSPYLQIVLFIPEIKFEFMAPLQHCQHRMKCSCFHLTQLIV